MRSRSERGSWARIAMIGNPMLAHFSAGTVGRGAFMDGRWTSQTLNSKEAKTEGPFENFGPAQPRAGL